MANHETPDLTFFYGHLPPLLMHAVELVTVLETDITISWLDLDTRRDPFSNERDFVVEPDKEELMRGAFERARMEFRGRVVEENVRRNGLPPINYVADFSPNFPRYWVDATEATKSGIVIPGSVSRPVLETTVQAIAYHLHRERARNAGFRPEYLRPR